MRFLGTHGKAPGKESVTPAPFRQREPLNEMGPQRLPRNCVGVYLLDGDAARSRGVPLQV